MIDFSEICCTFAEKMRCGMKDESQNIEYKES